MISNSLPTPATTNLSTNLVNPTIATSSPLQISSPDRANLSPASDVTFAWANQLPENPTIAIDGSGNVYTYGNFQGTIDFDRSAQTLELTSNNNGSGNDLFITKQNAQGELLWAQQIGGEVGLRFGGAMTADKAGNLYLAGETFGGTDFDPSEEVRELNGDGTFLASFDTNGKLRWTQQYREDIPIGFDAIALDEDNGLLYTSGNLRLGSYVSLYNYITGELVWSKPVGQPFPEGASLIHAIATDATGNLYATGSFSGTVDVDPSLTQTVLSSVNGTRDGFVIKLDQRGDFSWVKSFGGAGEDISHGIAIDRAGQIYLTGEFEGMADLDPGLGVAQLTSAGSSDGFVMALNLAGDLIWARQLGGADTDRGLAIGVDRAGNVYTTGSFEGRADFDPSGEQQLLSSTHYDPDRGFQDSDIFVSQLDRSGNFGWVKAVGSLGQDFSHALVVSPEGTLYLAGSADLTDIAFPNLDIDPGIGIIPLTGDVFGFVTQWTTAISPPIDPTTMVPVVLWRDQQAGTVYLWNLNAADPTQVQLKVGAGLDWVAKGSADFDGDRDVDYLWQNTVTGEISVWQMQGFEIARAVTLGTTTWQLDSIGQFNGDQHLDLLLRSQTGSLQIWNLAGFERQGVTDVAIDPGTDWKILASLDMNGDGNSELLWQQISTGQTAYWSIEQNQYKTGGLIYRIGDSADWQFKGHYDVDSDGDQDLLWFNPTTQQSGFWVMDTTHLVRGVMLLTVPVDWELQGVDDLGGDSAGELLWHNCVSRDVAIWELPKGSWAAIETLTAPVTRTIGKSLTNRPWKAISIAQTLELDAKK